MRVSVTTMLIIELFLHYGAVKELNHLPTVLLLVDVRAVIQYVRSWRSRLYFVKAEDSGEATEVCNERGGRVKVLGVGGGGWLVSQQCFITSNNIRNEVLGI